MKKMMVFILAAAICFGLFSGMAFAQKKTVGVMWIGKSGMALRVLNGFKSFMEKKASDIEIEYKTELADEAAARSVYMKFQEEKDAVVFLRSTGAKFMGKNPPKKPSFFGGCSNPVALGAVPDMEAPGGKITGVTYYITAERQLNVFRMVFPDMKSVGLLVEKGHPSGAIDTGETSAACKENGLQYHAVECSGKDQLADAVKSLVEKKVSIIIIGNQALIIDNADIVAENSGGIPVVSYAEKPIKKQFALCGLVPDDGKLGKILANSVIQVLKMEGDIAKIPVGTDPSPKFVVNMPMMRKMKLTIPASLMKAAKKIE